MHVFVLHACLFISHATAEWRHGGDVMGKAKPCNSCVWVNRSSSDSDPSTGPGPSNSKLTGTVRRGPRTNGLRARTHGAMGKMLAHQVKEPVAISSFYYPKIKRMYISLFKESIFLFLLYICKKNADL